MSNTDTHDSTDIEQYETTSKSRSEILKQELQREKYESLRTALRILVATAAAVSAAALTYLVFDVGISQTNLGIIGISTVLTAAFYAGWLSWEMVDLTDDQYNAAQIEVKGPIKRETPKAMGNTERTAADDVMEQIYEADADDNVEALVVALNTPGGEIVPSDDIKIAVENFDGPTVAYATDKCASGGYLIASACDEIVARKGSMVGSIGVRGSQHNMSGLSEKLGVEYERFTAGEYKDAGAPTKEMDEDEREYIQNLIDTHYEQFVEEVAEGRDLSEEAVRATEAKVFLGPDAKEKGLVDEIGTEEKVDEIIKQKLDTTAVEVEDFTPPTSAFERLTSGAQSASYSLGAGIADRLTSQEQSSSIEIEYRRR